MAHSAKWIQAKPDEPVVDVAKRSLAERLGRVQSFLPLASLHWKDDSEYVHMLRVSSRRAQSAFAIYGEFVPQWRAARMDEQLKHIREASNDARDDDVFIRRLEKEMKNEGASKLVHRVRAHRAEAQKSIVQVYNRLHKNNRFERHIDKLLKRTRLRGKKIKSKNPNFSDWARMKFARVMKDFDAATQCDYSDMEALHRLRITGKKVRYAMELLSAAFSERFRKDAYSGLEKLQDKLGDINDHFNAKNRIQFWLEEATSAKKPEIRYLKETLEQEELLLEKSLDNFHDWWNKKREAKILENFQDAMDAPLS